MKSLRLVLFLLLAVAGTISAGVQTASQLQNMPLAFTQNQGQWPDSILFRADAAGAVMWFTRDGVYYQFTRRIERADQVGDPGGPHDPLGRDTFKTDSAPDSVETMLVKAAFVGSSPMVEVVGEGLLDYKCNYFLGSDPTKWRTDVPNYSEIVYEDVYPGIDLRFHGEGRGQTAYEFVGEPGADLSRIDIAYEGDVTTSSDPDGRLVATTAWGAVFDATGASTADTPVMCPAASSARVVDRFSGQAQSKGVTLEYSTFLGGSGVDEGDGIAVDGFGCAYVTGNTLSADFPTRNAYDSSFNAAFDVFVTKFSAAGDSLVYSTFLGGSGEEMVYGIAVDTAGCAYVTGYTRSQDFPLKNAYDSSLSFDDAFVTKFSSVGNSLIFSTFLGGSVGSDEGYGVAVDSSGCAYVTGYTYCPDFPTQNAYDASYDGNADVFVTKFSAVGNALVYSTFLGGLSGEYGFAIAVDGLGCAYVTGITNSTHFPTQNAYDASYSEDDPGDVFVTKFSAAGDSLVYSTFLGGSGYENSRAVAVDGGGCAYVTGYTESSDFPSQNAFDASYGGSDDAYVTKFSAEGNALVYSTFLGGWDLDFGTGIAVDASGCAYTTGYTRSSDFPTESAFDGSYNGGDDVFVTKFSEGGNSLVYSTFLGGSAYEHGYRIAVGGDGCAYVTGSTGSSDFPTQNAYDSSPNGGGDVFVTKLSSAISCCIIRGDIDHDGTGPNITDLVYLVAYMFDSGPAAPCPEEADIDGNQAGPDIADLVYLVTYMFASGPAPAPCP